MRPGREGFGSVREPDTSEPKMQKSIYSTLLLGMGLFGAANSAQVAPQQKHAVTASLCVLQKRVGEGKHETVRVSGLYGPGLDRAVLEDPSCPVENTWVELDLTSDHNKQELQKQLNDSQRAFVVVEGEFYGPPLPDPKVPQTIRQSYHPGWGHLAAFRTKIVIHAIREVRALPANAAPASH